MEDVGAQAITQKRSEGLGGTCEQTWHPRRCDTRQRRRASASVSWEPHCPQGKRGRNTAPRNLGSAAGLMRNSPPACQMWAVGVADVRGSCVQAQHLPGSTQRFPYVRASGKLVVQLRGGTVILADLGLRMKNSFSTAGRRMGSQGWFSEVVLASCSSPGETKVNVLI